MQQSPEAFLAGLSPETKRADALRLLQMMAEESGASATMWGDSIVGFGRYALRYANGREAEWFRVGFSPRKQNFALYLMGGTEAQGEHLARLGKHSTGKSCLYIKRLSDVDEAVLRSLIRAAFEALG